MKLLYKFIFAYLFLAVAFVSFLTQQKNSKVNNFKSHYISDIVNQYNALYNEYKRISEIIFTTEINTSDVIDIFKNAHVSNDDEKKAIRKNLYSHLEKTYNLLQQQNLKQLHFHLPNNKSFLRFHRSNKFGDDLSKTRATVNYVNQYKKPIDTFEEGKIYNGYRFVFPLFDKSSNHIGSVEISFSTLAFNLEFIKVFGSCTNFLISKNIIDQKLFKDEKKNYNTTPFSNYMVEKGTFEKIYNSCKDKQHPHSKKLSAKTIETINQTKEKILVYDKKINKLLTVIPIKNKISNEIVGLFVVKDSAEPLNSITKNYTFVLFLVLVLLFGFLYYLYEVQLKKLFLNTIISEADSGIGVIDIKGNFKKINHIYCELLGYSEQELLQLNCKELTHKEDQDFANKTFQKAIKYGHICKIQKRCIAKNGEVKHLEMSLNMLPSKQEFIIVINSIEDKMKLHQLNTDLEKKVSQAIDDIRLKDKILFQQSKTAAMGEMIDAIAHQWKSPLGIIKLYNSQIEYDIQNNHKIDNQELLEYSVKTAKQIDHLVETIDEFRSFFRPKSDIVDIPIKLLLDSVQSLMKDELMKHNIEIVTQGDTTKTVKVIPNEFKHILINLINNSKDAFIENSIKNPKITVTVDTSKSQTLIKIEDNGGGISNDAIDKIFEHNFTTKKEDKGTGVGLYMSKQIIEKIDGSIEAKNISNGVCFTITI